MSERDWRDVVREAKATLARPDLDPDDRRRIEVKLEELRETARALIALAPPEYQREVTW